MNIIEAFAELKEKNPAASTVAHFQGEEWEIDQLLDVFESLESLEETSDGGQWCVDLFGVYQLDAFSFRNGNSYVIC